MTKYEATQKALKRIHLTSKDAVSKEIGITRATLDSRLKWHKWKVSEIFLIEKL